MANTLREVLVRISANSTGLDRELTTAIGKTKRFGQEMASIGQSMTFALALPITAFGAAALKAAGDMDALERGLKATTKEAGPITNQLERLRQIAKLPGLGFQEAVQGSINLQAVGLSAATSERYIKVFGNALASVGRGKADLDGVIVQLQQMSGKSKVLAEDVKPLVQRVPQLAAAMQKLFGTIDTEQLQKMGITSKQFVDAVVGELEKLPQATGGVKNAFENLADSSNQALARVGKVLVENFQLDQKLDALGKAIENAGASFSRMSPFAQNAAIALGGITAAAPLAVVAIGTVITQTGTVINFFRTWETAAVSLKFALVALAAAGIYAVVAAWRDMNKSQESADKWSKIYGDSLSILESKLRQHGADISLLRKEYDAGRLTQDQYAAALRKMALATGELVKPTIAVADAAKVHTAAVAAAAAAQEAWGGPIRKTTSEMLAQLEVFEKLTAATNQVAADKIFNSSGIDLMGSMTPPDVLSKEQQDAAKAAMDAWGGLGASIDKELSDALKRGAEQYPKVEKAAKKSGAEQKNVWNEVDREVSKAFGHMARGMADSIVHWKGFGETLKSVAQSFASGIMEIMIRQLFKPLEDRLASALGGLAGTASKPGIINNAVSGGGSVGSIGGSGGSAGGGALSSVGGLAGAVNVASGVVGAVSAVIGNFQMAGMNKSLDLVVKHTLQTANDMANLRADQWARHAALFTKLDDLAQFSWRKMDELITSARNGGGGAGGQTIQLVVDGKVLATAIARAVAVQSPAFG